MKGNWWLLSLRGIVLTLAGIYLMGAAESVTDFVLRIIGAFILLSGGMGFLAAWPNRSIAQGKRALWRSGIDLLIGLSIVLFPGLLSGFISLIIGFWLLFNAISFIGQSLRERRNRQPSWTYRLLIGFLLGLLSVWMITEPKQLMESLTFFLGLAITLFGLVSLGLAYSSKKSMR